MLAPNLSPSTARLCPEASCIVLSPWQARHSDCAGRRAEAPAQTIAAQITASHGTDQYLVSGASRESLAVATSPASSPSTIAASGICCLLSPQALPDCVAPSARSAREKGSATGTPRRRPIAFCRSDTYHKEDARCGTAAACGVAKITQDRTVFRVGVKPDVMRMDRARESS